MKKCRGCGIEKCLDEYYVHSLMRDGHLNFCKECVKVRVRSFGRSPEGREYDRLRFKTAKRKAWMRQYQRKRRLKDWEKFYARGVLDRTVASGKMIRRPCERCQDPKTQGHHPDYSQPLKVIWLCGVHHRELHKQYQRKK